MDVNKVSKTVSVVAMIAVAIFGTFGLLLSFGGNSASANVPNTLCFVSLFIWGIAFLVMRFSRKGT